MDVHLIAQPNTSVADRLASAAGKITFARVRMAFAYASEQGVDLFESALTASETWPNADKRILVGIDHGLTQPQALRRLRGLSHAEVRIPDAEAVLRSRALTRPVTFHPKIVIFESDRRPLLILAGSSNLTRTGLVRNAEAGILVENPDVSPGARTILGCAFDDWWRQQWQGALSATDGLIERYEGLRARLRRVAPERFVNEEPSPSEIASAKSFWITSSVMGGSWNQLELPQGVEAFFGGPQPRAGARSVLQLTNDGEEWEGWLRFWGNEVWRIRMPTAREGGQDYRSTVVRFTKTRRPAAFRISAVRLNSPEAAAWRQRSLRGGNLRVTTSGPGGRQYGWF